MSSKLLGNGDTARHCAQDLLKYNEDRWQVAKIRVRLDLLTKWCKEVWKQQEIYLVDVSRNCSASQRTLMTLQCVHLPVSLFWGALMPWCRHIMVFRRKSGTMVLCSANGAVLCEDGAGTGMTNAWRKVPRVSRCKSDKMTECQHGGEREEC